MSCAIETALAALDRGHVAWWQLHPRVRIRLEHEGYSSADPWGTEPSEDQRVLQFRDRSKAGGMWFCARKRMQKLTSA